MLITDMNRFKFAFRLLLKNPGITAGCSASVIKSIPSLIVDETPMPLVA